MSRDNLLEARVSALEQRFALGIGPPGPAGAAGAQGPPGTNSTWHALTEAPTPSLGVDGDWAINNLDAAGGSGYSWYVYHKTGGIWQLFVIGTTP